jgi:hypothetical protein
MSHTTQINICWSYQYVTFNMKQSCNWEFIKLLHTAADLKKIQRFTTLPTDKA